MVTAATTHQIAVRGPSSKSAPNNNRHDASAASGAYWSHAPSRRGNAPEPAALDGDGPEVDREVRAGELDPGAAVGVGYGNGHEDGEWDRDEDQELVERTVAQVDRGAEPRELGPQPPHEPGQEQAATEPGKVVDRGEDAGDLGDGEHEHEVEEELEVGGVAPRRLLELDLALVGFGHRMSLVLVGVGSSTRQCRTARTGKHRDRGHLG